MAGTMYMAGTACMVGTVCMRQVFGIVFAMVGGMMVFIVCHELLPAAHRYMNNTVKTTAWLVAGMFIMATSLVMFVQ